MPLTEDQLTSFWSYVINQGSNAPSPWFSIINLYGGPGSQINVPSPDAAAYSDRDALWVLQVCRAVPLLGHLKRKHERQFELTNSELWIYCRP